jgi:hypothetical protein
MGPAIVMESMVIETVTMGQENRASDKEQRPIEPRIPVVLLRIQTDRLWRQRVGLLRQAGRVQRDLPVAIRLLACLPDGLSLLAFNRHLHGELAAILKRRLCWDECHIRRVRGNLSSTSLQDEHHYERQKGKRTSISWADR